MISTASAALTAGSAGLPGRQPPGQGQRRGGQHHRDEHPADPVGQPLDARLVGLRPLDQRDQVRQLGVLAGPGGADDQPAADHDRAGGDRAALGGLGGHRFPGHHAGVHRGLTELHHPVGGDHLPGPDHHPVTGPQLPGRDAPLGPVTGQHAGLPRPGGGQFPHRVPGITPRPGLIPPPGQQEHGHRRGDLQVDPAAGGVQQQLPRAHPGLPAVQDEHRVHRPAARRRDAE